MDIQQMIPALTEEEFNALKEDIKANGVIVPVVLDQHGAIVDGHHRVRACKELGIENYPTIVRVYPDEDSRTEDVLKLNLQRRHVDREQLKDLAWHLYSERKWSQTRIANVLGMAQSAISEWIQLRRNQVIRSDNLMQSLQSEEDYSIGADGKKYPRSILAKNRKETRRAIDLVSSLDAEDIEHLPTVADVDDLKKTVRQVHIQKTYLPDENALPPEIELYNEDFRTGMERIPDESVQLIFTDPPYGKEYIPLYEDLARLGARKLQEGGSLLCYVGHYAIPTVLHMMQTHLRYWWILSEHDYQQFARLHGTGVNVTWKPILWFVKGGRWNPEVYVNDGIESSLPDKSYHPWTQDVGTASYYIKFLTLPGDLVVDPFAGSGTTLLAAYRLQRKSIGFEVDYNHWLNAHRRLNDETLVCRDEARS